MRRICFSLVFLTNKWFEGLKMSDASSLEDLCCITKQGKPKCKQLNSNNQNWFNFQLNLCKCWFHVVYTSFYFSVFNGNDSPANLFKIQLLLQLIYFQSLEQRAKNEFSDRLTIHFSWWLRDWISLWCLPCILIQSTAAYLFQSWKSSFIWSPSASSIRKFFKPSRTYKIQIKEPLSLSV